MPMTKKERQEYQGTFDRLREENTKGVEEDRLHEIMAALHRHETTLQRLGAEGTGRELTAKEERKIESTENRVKQLADELGIPVEFNGDPRGPSIKFYLPSGRYNSWDGESWRILW